MSLESLFIKFTTIDSITFSFYLGIFMFISMATTLFIKQRDVLKEITKTSFPILLTCAILMGSSNIFFITAIKSTTVANVVIIFGTAALFASFFAYLIYKEKIGKNIILASFFMLVGLFVIFNEELDLGNMSGNIFALLSVITFSLAFVFMAKYTKISRVALTAIIGLYMALISLFLSDSLTIDFNTLGIIAVMGLFMGEVMKMAKGKANPKIIGKLIQEKLKSV